jgi:hypothetical protein
VIKGSRLPCVARQVTETVLARQAGQRFPSPARFLRDNVRQHADTASSRTRDILPTASYRRNQNRPISGLREGGGTVPVPVEPGTGAIPRRRQPPGSTTFRCRETRGVVFQGGSPEVPPSPGAARLRAASAQDAQTPQGQGREILHLPGSRHLCRTRRYMQGASSPATARRPCTSDALSAHFPRTGQRPVHRSMTALHPPGATGRPDGGRNSLASASRCRWVSGPRPATTRATHARSSSES